MTNIADPAGDDIAYWYEVLALARRLVITGNKAVRGDAATQQRADVDALRRPARQGTSAVRAARGRRSARREYRKYKQAEHVQDKWTKVMTCVEGASGKSLVGRGGVGIYTEFTVFFKVLVHDRHSYFGNDRHFQVSERSPAKSGAGLVLGKFRIVNVVISLLALAL